MITRTGTVVINAAFLEEIKADNVQLKCMLARATELLVEPIVYRVRTPQLVRLLTSLRDQLATHFSLEEYFGYFDDAIDVAPHLSTMADIMRAQHATLFSEICDMVDDAEKLLYKEASRGILPQLVQRFQAFHKKLRQHEAGEQELIMQALCEDIGVGD